VNPLKMIQLGLLVLAIAGAFYGKHLYDKNQELKAENLLLETQIGINEKNVELLTQLLNTERRNAEAKITALSELASEVPDVVYSQELPPSIQGVLDRFHSAIGLGN